MKKRDTRRTVVRYTLLLLCLAFVAGCGPVLSDGTLKQVDREVSFVQVIKDPASFTGRKVVFGGAILGVENLADRTVVEVLEEGMNSQLKPVDPDKSAGRFLVSYDGFKDPAIYMPGKLITVAGTITGAEKRKLGKGSYTYPVIKPIETYLWRETNYSDEPRIGIGVGIGIIN